MNFSVVRPEGPAMSLVPWPYLSVSMLKQLSFRKNAKKIANEHTRTQRKTDLLMVYLKVLCRALRRVCTKTCTFSALNLASAWDLGRAVPEVSSKSALW